MSTERTPILRPVTLFDRRGVTALEFALVAPVFLALLCGVVDSGWQFMTEIALEHGAHDATRFAMTGNSTIPGRTGVPACRGNTIIWLITSEAPSLLTSKNLQVTTSSDSGKTSQSAGQSGFGGSAGGTVVYTLNYAQAFITPLGPLLFGRHSVNHQLQLLVRNELYPVAGC